MRPAGRRNMVETEINWLEALRTGGEQYTVAVNALRGILLKGLRAALSGRNDVSEAQLEDFAQDALLRILEKLDSFAGRGRFTDWAYAIAVNTAFAELRRKRWRDVSLDTLLIDGRKLETLDLVSENLPGGDEDRERMVLALRQAVAEKLTARQRAAILGELQELPFDQIAQLLGTNRNAAYKMVHDARRALRRHLEDQGISVEDIRLIFAA